MSDRNYRPQAAREVLSKLTQVKASEGDVTIGSNYKGNRQKPKTHFTTTTTTSTTNHLGKNTVIVTNKSREPYANNGRRVLLSMALKQNYAWSKGATQVASEIGQTEPVYFNVSLDRKLPINLYWEERQNSDFRRWIQHRRVVDFGTKKAVDNNLPAVHMDKISKNARVLQARLKSVNKYLSDENKRMKQRLSRVKGQYSAQKWAVDYQSHVQITHHISKLPRPPSINANSVFQKIARPPTNNSKSIYSYDNVSDTQTLLAERVHEKATTVVKQNTHPLPWNKALAKPKNPQQPPYQKMRMGGPMMVPAKLSNGPPVFTKRKPGQQAGPVTKGPPATIKSQPPMKDPREELGTDGGETEFDKGSVNSQPTSPAFPRRSLQKSEGTPVNDVYNYMKPFSMLNNVPSAESQNRYPKRSSLTGADSDQDKQSHAGMKVRFPSQQVGPTTPSPNNDEIGDDDNDDVPLPKPRYRRTPVPQLRDEIDKDDDVVVTPPPADDDDRQQQQQGVTDSVENKQQDAPPEQDSEIINKPTSPSAFPSSQNPAQTPDNDIPSPQTESNQKSAPDASVRTQVKQPSAISNEPDATVVDHSNNETEGVVANLPVLITKGLQDLTLNDNKSSTTDLDDNVFASHSTQEPSEAGNSNRDNKPEDSNEKHQLDEVKPEDRLFSPRTAELTPRDPQKGELPSQEVEPADSARTADVDVKAENEKAQLNGTSKEPPTDEQANIDG